MPLDLEGDGEEVGEEGADDDVEVEEFDGDGVLGGDVGLITLASDGDGDGVAILASSRSFLDLGGIAPTDFPSVADDATDAGSVVWLGEDRPASSEDTELEADRDGEGGTCE